MATGVRTFALFCLGTAVLAGAAALSYGARMAAGEKETVWPADKIVFERDKTGAEKAVLWGDPERGAHGALTKFPPGTKHPPHTHSSTFRIVVISGTLIYKSAGEERRLGAGSYLLIPAGRRHESGAGSEGALLFVESSGKFDVTPVEEGARGAPDSAEGGKAMMPPKRK